MYGMVNQAVKDLVTSKFGTSQWEKICQKANIPPDDFIFMHYYPDRLTYELVGSASSTLGLSPEVILNEFGKHWVLYTSKEGYGPLMDLFGSDFKTCLQNLNDLHARMGMTMPHLSPPRFSFHEEDAQTYIVSYFSKRSGLYPMVIGLIQGLAEKYKVTMTVVTIPSTDKEATHTFKIKLG